MAKKDKTPKSRGIKLYKESYFAIENMEDKNNAPPKRRTGRSKGVRLIFRLCAKKVFTPYKRRTASIIKDSKSCLGRVNTSVVIFVKVRGNIKKRMPSNATDAFSEYSIICSLELSFIDKFSY